METQAQVVGMPITYNGVNINQWFIATDVQRGLGTNHSNQLTKIGKTDGQYFQYMTRDTLTIAVTGYIRDDDDNTGIAAARRLLAQALDSDDLEQLIFGDEPDKYYLAITDGQASISETGYNGTVTLSFIVPDGVAHAVNTKTFSELDADGNIEVQSDGTYPSYPMLEATMTGDNGLVAFLNDNGSVLQFGSESEVDGKQHDDSEVMIAYTFDSAPANATLNTGVISYPYYLGDKSHPNSQVGTFDYTRNKEAATPTYNRTTANYWAGPSMYGAISANALGVNTGNFIWKNRLNITTNLKAVGRAEFTLSSGKSVAVSAVVRDSLKTADTLSFDGVYQNQSLFSIQLNRKIFTNGFYEIQVTRLGDQLTFQFAKIQALNSTGVHLSNAIIRKTFNISGFSALPIDGLTGWFPGFSNYTGWTINWSDSMFEWVNVDYWQDLPNRFSAGDDVVVDVQQRKVYVNGVEDATLQTIGNQWDQFTVGTGKTNIKPVCSSWANQFNAQVILREAFV